MLFINGEIRKEECLGKMFTLVKFEADELCKNYTPYVNLFLFCLLNNLIKKIEGKDEYVPNIDIIDLRESDDEKKNELARRICERYKIDII